MGRKPSELPRVTFRFPDELRDLIERAAEANNRSVNAEVIARLEASFGQLEKPFNEAQEAVVVQMVKDYGDRKWGDIQAKMKALEAKYEELFDGKPPPPGWVPGDPVP